MKRARRPTTITFWCPLDIQLEVRELQWLRTMAQHCIDTRMRGYDACKQLIAMMDSVGVSEYPAETPTYGLFEVSK